MSNAPMPIRSPADADARRAFARAAKLYDIADWHGIRPRTVDRIAAGDRVVPPGLAAAVAPVIDEINGDAEDDIAAIAAALRAWAAECEQGRADG